METINRSPDLQSGPSTTLSLSVLSLFDLFIFINYEVCVGNSYLEFFNNPNNGHSPVFELLETDTGFNKSVSLGLSVLTQCFVCFNG